MRSTVDGFLCFTKIRNSFFRCDGAIFHHHLHKVNQSLHDGDEGLSLLSILICNDKTNSTVLQIHPVFMKEFYCVLCTCVKALEQSVEVGEVLKVLQSVLRVEFIPVISVTHSVP